jgi:hypothetical protein
MVKPFFHLCSQEYHWYISLLTGQGVFRGEFASRSGGAGCSEEVGYERRFFSPYKPASYFPTDTEKT